MRILVAEDEQHLNKLITGKLQAEHYSVDCLLYTSRCV